MSASSLPAAPSASDEVPRSEVIAAVWREFGSGVAPLTNAAGRPSARTLKLLIDPLIVRPVQNPALASGHLAPPHAGELAERLREAYPLLSATASWFVELKSARRSLKITEGNPQDLYFQRCFELATAHSAPGVDLPHAEAARIAAETVQDVHRTAGESLLAQVRAVLADDAGAARLHRDLHAAWAARGAAGGTVRPERLRAALDACTAPGAGAAEFGVLVRDGAGRAAAAGVETDGAARAVGLSDRPRVEVPALGSAATKRDLPRPFDRSIFERLFADLASGSNREVYTDAHDLVADEIARSAGPWQLAREDSGVTMLLGTELARALAPDAPARPTAAQARLRGRWEREAYVRRALRLPGPSSGVPAEVRADVHDVHRNYLRRLWARLHGRELRDREPIDGEVWDVVDGVLRSVIMDQRHRLKRALVGEGAESA